MPMQGGFDASQYQPQQGVPQHPIGDKFRGTITDTAIEMNKDQTGGFLKVELKSDCGKAYIRYNLWHPNQQTVEIANKQLSALCHATGVFKLDYMNDAADLRNRQVLFDVAEQTNNKNFTQVTKVYDINGNEPGKAGAGPAQQMPMMQQPMQSQPQHGAWPQQQSQGQPMQPQQPWQQPGAAMQPGPGAFPQPMQPGPQQPPQAAQWPQQGQPQAVPAAMPGMPQQAPQPGPANWQQQQPPANVPWGQR